MFKVSGTVIAFAPSSGHGARSEMRERPRSGSRFTPLLSRRDTWLALKRKGAEQTFSAICLPGWDRG
jgi:hypothetical protein